jgi:hypothetical protein
MIRRGPDKDMERQGGAFKDDFAIAGARWSES